MYPKKQKTFEKYIGPIHKIGWRNFAISFNAILRLSEYGKSVGIRMLDLIVLRERGYRRDVKLLQMLMFVKGTIWKNLFGKEAEKLERSNDEPQKCTQNLKRKIIFTH